MVTEVKLIDIDKLRAHEKVSPERVVEVMEQIKKAGKIKKPVVVDKKTLVILDGHHRVEVMRRLGAKKVPVELVDYMSDKVMVCLRRKQLLMKVIKLAVIRAGLSNNVFPEKTTRHRINI